MHKRGLCRHVVSVRLSVCLSVTFVDSAETNKYIFIVFTVSYHSSCCIPSVMGTSNAGWIGKNRDSLRTAGSMTAAVRTTTAAVHSGRDDLLRRIIIAPSAYHYHYHYLTRYVATKWSVRLWTSLLREESMVRQTRQVWIYLHDDLFTTIFYSDAHTQSIQRRPLSHQ